MRVSLCLPVLVGGLLAVVPADDALAQGAKARPATSGAAPAADMEDAARLAIKRGLAAFARGEARAALAEYGKAQELVPHANLPYRYAGEAHAALDQVEEAVASFEKYLAIKPDVGDADLVRARIEQLRAKLVGIAVVSSLPAGAEVFVDDETVPRGKTPLRLERLPRGPHRLTVRLGERRGLGNVQILGGGEVSMAVELEAAAPATPAPSPTAPAAPAAPRSTSPWRTIGLVTGGLGAAALVSAAIIDVGILPGKLDTYERAANRGDGSASEERKSVSRLQTVGLAGYIAGSALLATGIVVFVVATPGGAGSTTAVLHPSGLRLAATFLGHTRPPRFIRRWC